MASPTVSVCMITYNHAPFIRQAVESVLMQQTDFEFELVIGEDCSTDETGDICQDLANANPNVVHLFRRSHNLGMHRNFQLTLDACRGEFIAFLEGDDYWTAPDKLQTQVNKLRQHPEWSGCFHRCDTVDEREVRNPAALRNQPTDECVDVLSLLRGNTIATCSMMARSNLMELPDWIQQLPMGDWPMWILLALKGPIGYLDSQMSVYRIHMGGVWGHKTAAWQIMQSLKVYLCLAQHCPTIDRHTLNDVATAAIDAATASSIALEKKNEALQGEIKAMRRSSTWQFGALCLSPLRALIRAVPASGMLRR